MKRFFLFPLAFCAAVLTSHDAFSQNLEKDPLKASGTIKGVAPGVLQIATGEGDTWLLKLEAKPQDVTFSGTAEKSFLRPGMFVEFRAQVSKKGVVAEPVASLTVFTPSEGRPPGVDPDGAGGGDGALFNEPKDEKKPEPKAKKSTRLQADDTIYRVAGAISKVGRAGDLTVSAGGAQVKFNLAEDCKISVEVNDLSFVSIGDKITVDGWFLKGRPGEGAANKIEVTAANPLTDGSKKKPTKLVKEPKTPVKGAKGEKGERGDKEEKPAEEKKDTEKKEAEKPEPKAEKE
ncbi:MAG: hypothetical protein IAF94_19300 [Pirellulaceae bacterium]|nr:hypothetical protein [Pirellulaceae bacterium]